MKLDRLIYKMLTENTGTHICDSGGSNGRMWQRNANKTLKDFINEPECTLDISSGYTDINISVFHHLCKTLELDDYCIKFNKLKCEEWNGDYYGTSEKQCEWLEKNDFTVDEYRREFNTYNFDCNLSQVLQGTFLRQGGYTDLYVLLQIYGGADVRGGYTDAKLFKVTDYFLFDACSFCINDKYAIDVSGTDISLYNYETYDNEYLSNDKFEAWAEKQSVKQFTGGLHY